MCSLGSNPVSKMHHSITVGLCMLLHINMEQSHSALKLMATNIKEYCHVHYCCKSLELCNLITLVFLAADTKVMAVGQPVGSVSVSYHTATFTVCTCMTSRLPSDPRPPHWCGAVCLALMLRPGVDWAPLKPVTHVAFVWQPSRCKN